MMRKGYAPVKVGDTAGMSQEEFSMSRTGLGGSDQGTLLGVSPFGSLYGLWLRCTGQEVPQASDPEQEFIFYRGHVMEELVAKVFQMRTGFTIINDTGIYAHPDYPYLRANLDRLYERPAYDTDGNYLGTVRGILELKTALPNTPAVENEWKKGIVPIYYLAQVIFYMAIMNLDEAYIACMWGIDTHDYVHIRITRDLFREDALIQKNVHFWETYVIPRRRPPIDYDQKADPTIAILKQQKVPNTKLPTRTLPSSLLDVIDKIEEVDQKLAEKKEEIRLLEEEKKRLKLPLYDEMGQFCNGILPCGDNRHYYDVCYKPRTTKKISPAVLLREYPELIPHYTSVRMTDLKQDFPVIYEDLAETVSTDAGRALLIKKKEFNAVSRLEYEITRK